jgi:hypothetical protein
MSEDTTKYVICEHDQPASIKGSVARTETILLWRNSLVSIGLTHLLEGTCFAIASTASDPGSFSHLYPMQRQLSSSLMAATQQVLSLRLSQR